jgi:hypothetical protein
VGLQAGAAGTEVSREPLNILARTTLAETLTFGKAM